MSDNKQRPSDEIDRNLPLSVANQATGGMLRVVRNKLNDATNTITRAYTAGQQKAKEKTKEKKRPPVPRAKPVLSKKAVLSDMLQAIVTHKL